jgi:hypothetical protein
MHLIAYRVLVAVACVITLCLGLAFGTLPASAQNAPLVDTRSAPRPIDELGAAIQNIAESCRRKNDSTCVNTATMIFTTRVMIRYSCTQTAIMVDLASTQGQQILGECALQMHEIDSFARAVYDIRSPKRSAR